MFGTIVRPGVYIMTVLHIAVMGITFLYMFNKAHFASTRLVSLVPLLMLLTDGCTAGVDFFALPLLGVLMEVLRLVVLGCCAFAMRRDAHQYAVRKRRRVLREMKARVAALPNPVDAVDAPCFA